MELKVEDVKNIQSITVCKKILRQSIAQNDKLNQELRHQKYKRCYHIALTLRKRLDDSFLESSLQITWLIKWINRWLELANKFKELK